MKLGPTDNHPLGTPVSQALRGDVAPELRESFNSVLNLVDEVHGDGNLPSIPVSLVTKVEARGWSAYTERTTLGTPIQLGFTRECIREQQDMLHEIGHVIDMAGVPRSPGDPLFQSEKGRDGVFPNWWEAVKKSKACLYLEKNKEPYYSMPKELFARSYVQFIAEKSQDKAMVERIQMGYRPDLPYQWRPRDFEPIMKGLEADFKALGWIQ